MNDWCPVAEIQSQTHDRNNRKFGNQQGPIFLKALTTQVDLSSIGFMPHLSRVKQMYSITIMNWYFVCTTRGRLDCNGDSTLKKPCLA